MHTATAPTLDSLTAQGNAIRRSMDLARVRQQKAEDLRIMEHQRKHRKLVRQAIVASKALAVQAIIKYDKGIKQANRDGEDTYGIPLVRGGPSYRDFLYFYGLTALHIESGGWGEYMKNTRAEDYRPETRHLKRGLAPKNCGYDFSTEEEPDYKKYLSELVALRAAIVYMERNFDVFLEPRRNVEMVTSYNFVISWDTHTTWWRYPGCPHAYARDPDYVF